MENITYTTAALKDFNGIVELLHQLWPEKKLDKELLLITFKRGLRSKNQTFFVAKNNDNIVGFGSLSIKNSIWQAGYLAHIDELIVDEQYRGEKIGSQILLHLTEIAFEKGCKKIELDSAHHRIAAHKFYEHKGFINRAALFSKDLV